MPLPIIAEIGIDQRLRLLVTHFVKSGLVLEHELPRFDAVIQKVTQLQDHALAELLMLALAYIPSLAVQNHELLMASVSSWHSMPAVSGHTLSDAGWWFRLVSAPIFRFLRLRWMWRMLLWGLLLSQVSKLSLVFIPTHPDMALGLGFLAQALLRFGSIVFAGGAVVAAQVGNALAYEGATLGGLKFIILGYCVWAVIVLVVALFPLIPTLRGVKKRGLLITEPWRTTTRVCSTPSGFMGSQGKVRRSWAVRTSSRWPTSITAPLPCAG